MNIAQHYMTHDILIATHSPAHCVMSVLSMANGEIQELVLFHERHPLYRIHANIRLDKYYSTVSR